MSSLKLTDRWVDPFRERPAGSFWRAVPKNAERGVELAEGVCEGVDVAVGSDLEVEGTWMRKAFRG